MSQRLSLRGPLLWATAISLFLVALFYVLPTQAQVITPAAVATNTADIVVQFGDGLVVTRRITFTGTISGLEALRRTGLALVEKNGGVCRIADTGCAAGEDCFCACAPPNYAPCLFWSYQRWDGHAWGSSSQGAGATSVSNGAVEGWTWGRELPPARPAVLGASAGLHWLAPRQNSDGSYGGSGGNAGATIDTLLANRALGGDAAAWKSAAGNSLVDALRTRAAAYAARGPATAGKLALGLAAADQDPRAFAGLNLVISMTASFDPATGAYGATNWDQAFAMLGLRAAGEAVPPAAANVLKARANADGGWGFVPEVAPGSSDIDSTGLMLQALIAANVPPTDSVIVKALAYLDAAQNDDGGFPDASMGNSDTSNADSTAFAIQGILASGGDPLAARWRPIATNPISYLLGLQQPDGAFTYGGQPSQLATQQVIPALAGRPFPFLSRAVAAHSALGFIKTQQQADGSFTGFGLGATLDAILAIDAAGGDPQSFAKALDYLRPRAAAYAAKSAAATGKLTAAIVAAGANPRSFAGLNLVISTTLRYDASTGAFGSSTFDQAWAMLGLAAAGQTIPVSATERLQAIQATGGGWGFDANAAAGEADSTGLALQALAAGGVKLDAATAKLITAAICTTGAGSSNPAVQAALAFLRKVENNDGGFPGFGGPTSADSTGLALQGLAAHGDTPRGLSWTNVITDGSASALTLRNPVDALLALQTLEGGFPGFGGPNDPSATYQALPGLLGRAFPASIRTLRYLPVMRR